MDRDACDAIGRGLDCGDKAGVFLSFLFVPQVPPDIANQAYRPRTSLQSRHQLRDCNDGGPGVIKCWLSMKERRDLLGTARWRSIRSTTSERWDSSRRERQGPELLLALADPATDTARWSESCWRRAGWRAGRSLPCRERTISCSTSPHSSIAFDLSSGHRSLVELRGETRVVMAVGDDGI